MKKNILFLYTLAFLLAGPAHVIAQWKPTNGPNGGTVYCFAISDSNIFCGTAQGVYLSTDKGSIWTAMNNGFPNTTVYSLVTRGTNIFAGTDSGLYVST